MLHVALKDDQDLKQFEAQLAQRDPAAFKQRVPKLVDVLHYGDAAQMPMESAAQILGDWQGVPAGRRLGLARVWEEAPPTGQDAQNVSRLKRLVETLQPLIDPPGTGVIAAVPQSPAGIDDAGYDGGMLLATLPDAPAKDRLHRVFLVDTVIFEALQSMLASVQAGSIQPTAVLDLLKEKALQVLDIIFPAGGAEPRPADIDVLKLAMVSFPRPQAIALLAAGKVGADQALADQTAICKPFSPNLQPAAAAQALGIADFGDGVLEASVMSIDLIG